MIDEKRRLENSIEQLLCSLGWEASFVCEYDIEPEDCWEFLLSIKGKPIGLLNTGSKFIDSTGDIHITCDFDDYPSSKPWYEFFLTFDGNNIAYLTKDHESGMLDRIPTPINYKSLMFEAQYSEEGPANNFVSEDEFPDSNEKTYSISLHSFVGEGHLNVQPSKKKKISGRRLPDFMMRHIPKKTRKEEVDLDILKNQIEELTKAQQKNNKDLKSLADTMEVYQAETSEKLDRNYNMILSVQEKLSSDIKSLKSSLSLYQSFVFKELECFRDDLEKDIIQSCYADTVAEIIARKISSYKNYDLYAKETEELKNALGENVWKKLDERSKKFLITAKVTFIGQRDCEDMIDYSGICLLLTKAVEVECTNRFYTHFLKYLKEKNEDDYPSWLIDKKTNAVLDPKQFTLGTVKYALCYHPEYSWKSKQLIKDETILFKYADDVLFENDHIMDHKSILFEDAEHIEYIRKNFRNPAAHGNALQYQSAAMCMDYIVDGEQILRKMLTDFCF